MQKNTCYTILIYIIGLAYIFLFFESCCDSTRYNTQKECNCELSLPLFNEDAVPIYIYQVKNKSSLTVVDSIYSFYENDPLMIIFNFRICNIKDSLAEGHLEGEIYADLPNKYNLILKNTKGYIKCKYLYLSFSTYDTLILYSNHNHNSKKIKIPKPVFLTLKVINCWKNWIYVEYNDSIHKQKINGWLAPEHQCANVLTTCN